MNPVCLKESKSSWHLVLQNNKTALRNYRNHSTCKLLIGAISKMTIHVTRRDKSDILKMFSFQNTEKKNKMLGKKLSSLLKRELTGNCLREIFFHGFQLTINLTVFLMSECLLVKKKY